RPSAAGTA
ncbi:hypothetical protein Tco_0636265, partial [Tanacetum coccineum]